MGLTLPIAYCTHTRAHKEKQLFLRIWLSLIQNQTQTHTYTMDHDRELLTARTRPDRPFTISLCVKPNVVKEVSVFVFMTGWKRWIERERKERNFMSPCEHLLYFFCLCVFHTYASAAVFLDFFRMCKDLWVVTKVSLDWAALQCWAFWLIFLWKIKLLHTSFS